MSNHSFSGGTASPGGSAEKVKAALGEPEHGSFGKRADSPLGNESNDSLAGRLLVLRRILLTAVDLIEDIVFPTGGGPR